MGLPDLADLLNGDILSPFQPAAAQAIQPADMGSASNAMDTGSVASSALLAAVIPVSIDPGPESSASPSPGRALAPLSVTSGTPRLFLDTGTYPGI